ncbi:hypothetical protein ABW20_dc0110566 [Dactylellina cionopaga]|nr:hypothetical protein ABW20_dc0110566 [Dactylellina cionopaga]
MHGNNETHRFGGSDSLHRLLGTNIITHRISLSSFGRRQQICTQPKPPIFTFDDTDENGILRISIDASQRAKEFTDSCASCESIGPGMAGVVHGECVELFRIRCDERPNGSRRIEGLELDLRPQRNMSTEGVSKGVHSSRIQLLEARMRGNESGAPSSEKQEPIGDHTDSINMLKSVRLIKRIEAIGEKWEDGGKRRRLVTEGDLLSKINQEDEEPAPAKLSKKVTTEESLTKVNSNS